MLKVVGFKKYFLLLGQIKHTLSLVSIIVPSRPFPKYWRFLEVTENIKKMFYFCWTAAFSEKGKS